MTKRIVLPYKEHTLGAPQMRALYEHAKSKFGDKYNEFLESWGIESIKMTKEELQEAHPDWYKKMVEKHGKDVEFV